jgi:D-alanine--poly(phosphoribitol) ligase subunit 1
VTLADELFSFVESASIVDETRLREHLVKRLPFHAVPKRIRAIEVLPRNSNGKIDRQALEQMASS